LPDLLAAESSLTQRQAELDLLRAQRTALGDQMSYATINVTLSAEPTVITVVPSARWDTAGSRCSPPSAVS